VDIEPAKGGNRAGVTPVRLLPTRTRQRCSKVPEGWRSPKKNTTMPAQKALHFGVERPYYTGNRVS